MMIRTKKEKDRHKQLTTQRLVTSESTSHQQQENVIAPPGVATARKDQTTGHYVFEYDETTICQWEQSLEEVNNIYVTAPRGVKASQLSCNITSTRLQLGLQGNDRFLIDE